MRAKEAWFLLIRGTIGLVALILIGIRIGETIIEKIIIALGLIFLYHILYQLIEEIVLKLFESNKK